MDWPDFLSKPDDLLWQPFSFINAKPFCRILTKPRQWHYMLPISRLTAALELDHMQSWVLSCLHCCWGRPAGSMCQAHVLYYPAISPQWHYKEVAGYKGIFSQDHHCMCSLLFLCDFARQACISFQEQVRKKQHCFHVWPGKTLISFSL